MIRHVTIFNKAHGDDITHSVGQPRTIADLGEGAAVCTSARGF
jgi:hypothetical protein